MSAVCKLWRSESIQFLYEYITIYRPGHLQALRESLRLDPQNASYIRRLEISAAGTLVGYDNLGKGKDSQLFVDLFEQCPNLTTLTIGPAVPVIDSSSYTIPKLDWTAALAPLASQITHLTITADYTRSRGGIADILLALGTNLRFLAIQNNIDAFTSTTTSVGTSTQTDPWIYEVRLPLLHSLVLHAGYVDGPLHWEMRSLRAMTISHRYGSDILRRYGPQLEYLCLLDEDTPQNIFPEYCPSLQHLVMSSKDVPMKGVKQIDFWVRDTHPTILETASPSSRFFDADLLHPEFGCPTLPYLLPPTKEAQLEADFVGANSHYIQVTEQGRVFTGKNCRVGSVRPLTSYDASRLEPGDEARRLAVRQQKHKIKSEQGRAGPEGWSSDPEDSESDSDWHSSVQLSDIEYETDSSLDE